MDFDRPPANPIEPFLAWLRDAERLDLPNPNAMSLATVDPDGRPSVRIVLLKGFDERGAVFFTNCRSRKGRALEAHPRAALHFHWDPLHRQVTIEGAVTRVSDEESDAYFATRPRASQLGAWASRQSEPAAARGELDAAFAAMEKRFEGRDVTRPPHWGGYRVALERIAFWEARAFRMHDRIVYTPDDAGGWRVQRLYP